MYEKNHYNKKKSQKENPDIHSQMHSYSDGHTQTQSQFYMLKIQLTKGKENPRTH